MVPLNSTCWLLVRLTTLATFWLTEEISMTQSWGATLSLLWREIATVQFCLIIIKINNLLIKQVTPTLRHRMITEYLEYFRALIVNISWVWNIVRYRHSGHFYWNYYGRNLLRLQHHLQWQLPQIISQLVAQLRLMINQQRLLNPGWPCLCLRSGVIFTFNVLLTPILSSLQTPPPSLDTPHHTQSE